MRVPRDHMAHVKMLSNECGVASTSPTKHEAHAWHQWGYRTWSLHAGYVWSADDDIDPATRATGRSRWLALEFSMAAWGHSVRAGATETPTVADTLAALFDLAGAELDGMDRD